MSFGKLKSRRRGVRYSRITSGKKRSQMKKRTHGALECKMCKALMHGSASSRIIPKTQKRPDRAFGGVLCANCVRILIKEQARKL